MLVTCWMLFEYGQGFLKQFRPRAAAATADACQEEEEDGERSTMMPPTSSTVPLSRQPLPSSPIAPHKASENGQVAKEKAPHAPAHAPVAAPAEVPAQQAPEASYSPSQGLPEHTPNRPSEARPKSGKVLKRKNTPALLPKVEKLYAKEKVSHNPICLEEDEEEEEEEEEGACGGGGGGGH